MLVDDVNNARRHGERNNSKDNGEGIGQERTAAKEDAAV